MGRVAQGGWLELARQVHDVWTRARDAGAHDPLAGVVGELGITRQAARRFLAAHDVVRRDLGRLRVTASLGSVEVWRLLSEVDAAWAGRIRDAVMTGAMPMSAVKDALETARALRAVPPGVAAMTVDDVVDAVRLATGIDMPFQDPKGAADEIPVDLEYRVVGASTADGVPRLDPWCALLISPALPLSRGHGRDPRAFRMAVMAAAGLYPSVVVACTSDVDRAALVAEFEEFRWLCGRLLFVTLTERPGHGRGAPARTGATEG